MSRKRTPHINQPGGRFRESLHEDVVGRELALRAMADAVRRLVRITTNNRADAEATAAAAERISRLADELDDLVTGDPPPRYGNLGVPEEPHDIFPYDPVLGLYNPLALPIEMSWEPPRAIGRARFDTPYEGPPGCVHGAVLAGAFDQVFNVANILSGTAGPTVTLTLEYRKPTRLDTDLVFEAWVERVEERKVESLGRLLDGDTVTAEARGLFVAIDREAVMRMRDA